MIPLWVSQYLGIPYLSYDCQHDGTHCWGLVRLVYGQEIGVHLPTYGAVDARDLLKIARCFRNDSALPPWRQVHGETQEFDVIVMAGLSRDGGAPRRAEMHCGVAVSSRHVLHVDRDGESVCVRRNHSSVAGRILSIWRHEARL